MKQAILLVISFAMMAANANYQWISVDRDTLNTLQSEMNGFIQTVNVEEMDENVAAVKIDESGKGILSHLMHEGFKRCPGYIAHDSLEDARKYANAHALGESAFNGLFADYSITEGDRVRDLVSKIEAINIQSVISKLSSFHNRYYTAQTGVQSSKWIRDTWASLANGRSDVSVELYNHANWAQPSVIMTVTGSETPSEIVVIGGHADSIAGWFGGQNARAPGADDNASGIATITEVIRALMNDGYKPKKTIKFMAYAAEEVGLKGSKEIAERYKREGKNVIGSMQLDMTNFKGSSQYDIVMMTDYTNAEQNTFLGKLIDEYVQVPWDIQNVVTVVQIMLHGI